LVDLFEMNISSAPASSLTPGPLGQSAVQSLNRLKSTANNVSAFCANKTTGCSVSELIEYYSKE